LEEALGRFVLIAVDDLSAGGLPARLACTRSAGRDDQTRDERRGGARVVVDAQRIAGGVEGIAEIRDARGLPLQPLPRHVVLRLAAGILDLEWRLLRHGGLATACLGRRPAGDEL